MLDTNQPSLPQPNFDSGSVPLGPQAAFFRPHPNLSDTVNSNIVQSEVEGGVFLESLAPSTVLQIRTRNHRYTAVMLGDNYAMLSGHPEFCPEPVMVSIAGSTWGGSMLKMRFVGRGMHLEFYHPEYSTPIITSPIQEIQECPMLTPPREATAWNQVS